MKKDTISNSDNSDFRLPTVVGRSTRAWLLLASWGIGLVAIAGAPCFGQGTPIDNQNSNSGANFTSWILKQPTGADAEFKMPVQPRYIERSFTPVQGKPPIKLRLYQGTLKGGKAAFVFGYHDLHEAPADGKQVAATLLGARNGSVVNVGGKLLTSENQTVQRFDNRPGVEFEYLYAQQEVIYRVQTRLVLDGQRLYQVSAIMQSADFDEQMAKTYINSFRIAKPDWDLPPQPPALKKSTGDQQ